MTLRRGICPGLADPLPTGDGLLARLAVTRPIPLDSLAAPQAVSARAPVSATAIGTARNLFSIFTAPTLGSTGCR